MLKHFRYAALPAFACLLMSCGVQAAEERRTPAAIIAALSDRIYALGETTANVADMDAAEAAAADEIRRYIASGATAGLLASSDGKPSPLASAASLGYPNVVAALLGSKLVAARIDEVDANGMTPWVAATLSLRESAPACNVDLFENPHAFIPLLVTQTWYANNTTPPYQATRERLEQAGARPDMEGARAAWEATCTNASPLAKARVRTAPDVQPAVRELGFHHFVAQLEELQKRRKTRMK